MCKRAGSITYQKRFLAVLIGDKTFMNGFTTWHEKDFSEERFWPFSVFPLACPLAVLKAKPRAAKR